MYWERYSHDKIKAIVNQALSENLTYRDKRPVLGIPATYLDSTEFYSDAPFLKDAPFMKTMVENPNHIGCHTLEQNEHLDIFEGTQKIERELIHLIAEEIFAGEKNQQDGYVATGGTEANIEAIWIYRNYFQKEFGAKPEEIALVYSEDSHYSMPKAANLLDLQSIILKVGENDRAILQEDLQKKIQDAQIQDVKYFIIIMNVSTTMFGSVDDIERITDYFERQKVEYKVHIDGAFGGFIYPFTNLSEDNPFTFKNPRISSFTIDGHKMLQTPYGTGIFLIRKNFMHYVRTEEAQYIPGKDYTVCGSRSGANAISVWMLMRIHGSEGLKIRMQTLNERTDRFCNRLDELNIPYFRNPYINIVTMKAGYFSVDLAKKYHLVADSYEFEAKWWKVVVMAHVKQGILEQFLIDLEEEIKNHKADNLKENLQQNFIQKAKSTEHKV